jgi:DNA-binding transcriptional LysR family regulator
MRKSDSQETSPRSAARRDPNVTIGALRAFIQAFEHGSFSKAAQSLGVSQPNISNQVSALEQALGARLMNRRGAALSLTDIGREVFVRARLALAKVAEIEDIAQEFRALRQGRLTVGFSSPSLAIPVLGRFRQVYPEVELSTASGNSEYLRQELLECQIDLALCSLLEPDAQLECQRLENLDLQLILPRDDPRYASGVAQLRDVAQEPLVFREAGSVTRALTEAALAPYRQWAGPALTVTGTTAVRSAVAAGLGLALVFRGEADDDRRLRTVTLDDGGHRAGFYLVTLPENLQIPSVEAFIALAQSQK